MVKNAGLGLVQVYTGDGKGKTTAALGLAMRAAGHGLRVGFIQFLKGERSGEHMFVSRCRLFEIVQFSNVSSFKRPREELRSDSQKTIAFAREQMLGGHYDLLVLDEIFIALHEGLITPEQVLDLIENKPTPLELVLTGRYAPPEIIARADLVTEMKNIKHPFQRGIAARLGIEF